MSTGIRITAEAPNKQHISEVTKAIERILAQGKVHHHDQETVRYALSILTKLTNVENVSISNTDMRVG